MAPKVVSRRGRRVNPGAVYVGRPSKWGNPFRGERREVIRKYEAWLLTERPDLVAAARQELRGRDLECWCAPRPCHADILLRVANS